ncbi:respiratory nitrate reductase subunit gamma [Thermodesulfobacteriota bacterium]
MLSILQLLTYAGGLVFVIVLVRKLLGYWSMPMHVRWELYPIPHEGKEWGGSFFEEVDHWKKTRHVDHMAQYKFMIPEILFIKALREDNRPLWIWSMPFHMGLYLSIGGLVFMVIGAVLQIVGLAPGSSALASIVQALMILLAVVGFAMGTVGALGLLVKRLTDPHLQDFNAPIDFLNLVWLAAIFVTGFVGFLMMPGAWFGVSREFLVNMLTFNIGAEIANFSTLHWINLLLFIGFVAYFPFTHMTHMISKYFMWDKVKWDDNPNVGDPGMDEKIKRYLAYPVTWSADHVGAEGGKKSWADIATFNPWEKKEEK